MRLRNIGWLVCAGTNLTELPISLQFSSVAALSPPPSYRPLSSCSFSLPLPFSVAPYKALFYSGLHSLTLSLSLLFSPIYRSTFRLLSLLSLNPLSRSPRHVHVETKSRAHYTHVHTCSRTYGSKVFARGGQYSPTTRTTPSCPGWKESRGGADGGGDTILPSCCGRDIFSLSRDNLETRVVLPGPESSEEKRLDPG